MRQGIAFELRDNSILSFDEIIHDLIKHENWGEKYSEDYVEKQIQDMLVKLLQDGNPGNAFQYFDALANEYDNYSQEHTVYIPILGIHMTIPQLALGKVVLKIMDDANFEALMQRIEKITHSLVNTPEEKEAFIQMQKGMLSQSLKGQVCAEYTTLAEPTRAQERGEEETRRVIDLFRYSIPALYPDDFNVFVGLQGEVVRVPRLTPILSTNDKSFNIQSNLIGALYPFELSQQNFEHMTKIGVLKLSSILSKNERDLNEFGKELLSAQFTGWQMPRISKKPKISSLVSSPVSRLSSHLEMEIPLVQQSLRL